MDMVEFRRRLTSTAQPHPWTPEGERGRGPWVDRLTELQRRRLEEFLRAQERATSRGGFLGDPLREELRTVRDTLREIIGAVNEVNEVTRTPAPQAHTPTQPSRASLDDMFRWVYGQVRRRPAGETRPPDSGQVGVANAWMSVGDSPPVPVVSWEPFPSPPRDTGGPPDGPEADVPVPDVPEAPRDDA